MRKNPSIPAPLRIFTIALIAAWSFFAYVYAFAPSMAFPGAEVWDYSTKLGFYSTGVRIMGSVLGLALALALDSVPMLAVMMATRLAIELGDIGVSLAIGGPMANTALVWAIALLELASLKTLADRMRRHK